VPQKSGAIQGWRILYRNNYL